jgi:predicted nucleic acid-binding protein
MSPIGDRGLLADEGGALHGIACDTMTLVLVVLDSNVLVAGFRSRNGASFRLLQLLRAGRFQVAVSVPLVLEYEAELVRHANTLGWRRQDAEGVVDYLCRIAHRQNIHFLWRPTLTDPKDEFVLELAVAAGCDAVVTHNVKDFAGASTFGLRVLSPSEFLKILEVPS